VFTKVKNDFWFSKDNRQLNRIGYKRSNSILNSIGYYRQVKILAIIESAQVM
jgi:hypothetical protein